MVGRDFRHMEYPQPGASRRRHGVTGNVFRAVVISTEGSSDRGRKFEQTLWYAPDSGLILKLVRRWDSAAVQHVLNGTNPGDFQQYELIHFVFLSGREMSLN